MATKFYYDESKNPDGEFYPGVPLADLTDEEYEAQPEWIQKAIDAHPMYRKTRPQEATRASDKPQEATKEAKGGEQ